MAKILLVITMELRSGYVRASGYANKIRKVLFAITRGKVEPKEVIRASAELNQYLFERFKEMGVRKEDVVRISIGFSIEEGTIVWDYDSLKIEVYRKEEEEKLAQAMEEVEEREKALDEAIKELEKLANQLRGLSEEIAGKVEKLKQEHSGLKLQAEE